MVGHVSVLDVLLGAPSVGEPVADSLLVRVRGGVVVVLVVGLVNADILREGDANESASGAIGEIEAETDLGTGRDVESTSAGLDGDGRGVGDGRGEGENGEGDLSVDEHDEEGGAEVFLEGCWVLLRE